MTSVLPLCYCRWQAGGKLLFYVILFLPVPVAGGWTQTLDFGLLWLVFKRCASAAGKLLENLRVSIWALHARSLKQPTLLM